MPSDPAELSGLLVPFLIILAIVLLVRRSRRLIARSGFRPLVGAPKEITEAAHAITGLDPVRAFRRGRSESLGWLVELTGGGSDEPSVYLLLYQVAGAGWPELAAFHTSDKLPRLLRRASGGLYGRLEPLRDPAAKACCAADWFLSAHPAGEAVEDLVRRLGQATREEGAEKLLAVAITGDHLGIWSDGLGLRPLLETGPRILQTVAQGRL